MPTALDNGIRSPRKLLAAGLSASRRGRALGHTDAALVWKRYGHALPDEVATAGAALAAFRASRGIDQPS